MILAMRTCKRMGLRPWLMAAGAPLCALLGRTGTTTKQCAEGALRAGLLVGWLLWLLGLSKKAACRMACEATSNSVLKYRGQ